MNIIPGLGIAQGHGADAAPLLRGPGHDPDPRGGAGRGRPLPRPAAAARRRVRQPQVRDLLPVRPGLPGRVHRHGRPRHARTASGPTGEPAETYAERREESALRRSGRPVPDSARGHVRADRHGAPATRSWSAASTTRRPMLTLLEEIQAAYGYLPVAALKHVSQATGAPYALLYGTASYYGHLSFGASDPNDRHLLLRRLPAGRARRGSAAAVGAALGIEMIGRGAAPERAVTSWSGCRSMPPARPRRSSRSTEPPRPGSRPGTPPPGRGPRPAPQGGTRREGRREGRRQAPGPRRTRRAARQGPGMSADVLPIPARWPHVLLPAASYERGPDAIPVTDLRRPWPPAPSPA